MELCLRFHESEIGYWATRYIETQRNSDRREERAVIDLRCEVQGRGLTRGELYQVAKWKSPRRVNLTLEPANTDSRVKKITQQAFSIEDPWLKLEKLTCLGGIGQARASAILQLYDKKPYPILDRHAVYSVGLERKTRNWYSESFWRKYVCFCRDIAKRNGFCMRTLDRALWAYSYINDE